MKTSAHDEPRTRDDDPLQDRDEQEVEHEVAPEALRVGGLDAQVMVREVVDHRDERVPEVERRHRQYAEPDPAAEAAVEHARGDEARQRHGVLEPVGVGPVAHVSARHVHGARSRGDRQIAHSRRGRDLQYQVTGERDAQCLEGVLGALVVTQLAVVAAGQDDETMRGIARVRRDRREELWYRQQRRLDGLGEIEARIAEE